MNQEIEDPTLVSCYYLTCLKGLKVTTFKKSDNRIVFHVEGNVEAILLDLSYNNKPALCGLWDWD